MSDTVESPHAISDPPECRPATETASLPELTRATLPIMRSSKQKPERQILTLNLFCFAVGT